MICKICKVQLSESGENEFRCSSCGRNYKLVCVDDADNAPQKQIYQARINLEKISDSDTELETEKLDLSEYSIYNGSESMSLSYAELKAKVIRDYQRLRNNQRLGSQEDDTSYESAKQGLNDNQRLSLYKDNAFYEPAKRSSSADDATDSNPYTREYRMSSDDVPRENSGASSSGTLMGVIALLLNLMSCCRLWQLLIASLLIGSIGMVNSLVNKKNDPDFKANKTGAVLCGVNYFLLVMNIYISILYLW